MPYAICQDTPSTTSRPVFGGSGAVAGASVAAGVAAGGFDVGAGGFVGVEAGAFDVGVAAGGFEGVL